METESIAIALSLGAFATAILALVDSARRRVKAADIMKYLLREISAVEGEANKRIDELSTGRRADMKLVDATLSSRLDELEDPAMTRRQRRPVWKGRKEVR